VNNEVANKTFLSFFTLAPLGVKEKLGTKLSALKNSSGIEINAQGRLET
jgi:hypothetical protein